MLNLSLATIAFFVLISGAPANASTELAKVGKTVITLEEFNKRYQEAVRFLPLKPPSKKDFLDQMIKREVAVQKAKSEGLDKDPEIIDRINTILYHGLIERKLGKEFENIRISDEEAEKYYSKYPEIRTSHILVAVRPGASPDEEKKALEKIKKIQAEYKQNSDKMSFSELAQRYSEGPTANMGGDIDYQSRDRLDPTYYNTALKLKVGQVSDPVRTAFGYHMIKRTGTHSFDETDKIQVKRVMFEEKKNEIFERFINREVAANKPTIKSDRL